MKKILKYQDESFKTAYKIVTTLINNGFAAFFVGGCVRDALLGLEPDEIDIATSAKPNEVKKLFKKTVSIGESFGVIIVIEENRTFEIATFRTEYAYSDGRHPDNVVYSESEQEDVLRRDFTVNGLLYDPVNNKLFDYVSGLKDIEKGVIRTIGDPYKRFGEDKLRMIRAIRFSSRYNFALDEQTFNSIKSMGEEINQVSVERIRDEIVKIISRDNPGQGLKLLSDAGLLVHILPEVDAMIGVHQPPEFHPEGDVFTHTCLVLDKLYDNTGGNYSAELAMGALLHDVGKPPTYQELDRIRFNGHDRVGAEISKVICKRLKFSKKQTERVVNLVMDHLKFKDVFNMRESTLKRFLSKPFFNEYMDLHLADCMASHGMLDAYEFVKGKISEYSQEEIKPNPLISGKDLISIGFRPGPIFSEILEIVESRQLENKLNSREDAIQFVINNYSLN